MLIFAPDMRVLMVNTSELTGGAAIAASRLTAALNALNGDGGREIAARLLVRDRQSSNPTTVPMPRRWHLRAAFLWERMRIWTANGWSRQGLWSVDIANAGADITALPAFREADIIHLHWVNQGFLSVRHIEKILLSGKPVAWTLHDLWPCTGICHHTGECDRYATHCHDCPQLRHPAARDLSWQTFEQKARVYAQGRLTFIAVSQWTATRARQSALTAGHAIRVIPNALPLELFQPADRRHSRRTLHLPEEAPVIAFGAVRIDHPLKGLSRLLEALRLLSQTSPNRPHLLLFGQLKDRSWLSRIPVPYTFIGPIGDPRRLCSLYSAANVLVCASDYETFGQTLAEAMACGCTPVSFDRGGQTDIIQHRCNGYLARYPDTADLAAGIRWALQERLSATMLRANAGSRFGGGVVARQHLKLYEEMLSAH